MSFISVSNYNYGEFEINLQGENEFFEIETQNDKVQLLINTEDFEKPLDADPFRKDTFFFQNRKKSG